MPRPFSLKPHKTGPVTSPWCVNVPARISESGKRERKFFVTESEAERYSKIHRVRIEKSRTEAARPSNAQKRDAAIEQTLSGLAACRELGILDEVEYLDLGRRSPGTRPRSLLASLRITSKYRSTFCDRIPALHDVIRRAKRPARSARRSNS